MPRFGTSVGDSRVERGASGAVDHNLALGDPNPHASRLGYSSASRAASVHLLVINSRALREGITEKSSLPAGTELSV